MPVLEGKELRIVGFLCNWCSYGGADTAGVARASQPTDLRIIRVPCSGRVDPLFVLKALLTGADGVLVSGCHPRDCHYTSGNFYARRRLEILKHFLPVLGIDPARFSYTWVSASEGQRWQQVVTRFTEEIHALGPAPGFENAEPLLTSLEDLLKDVAHEPCHPLATGQSRDLAALKDEIRKKLPDLDVVIGWQKGRDDLHTVPLFMRTAEDVDRFVWGPLNVVNPAGYLKTMRDRKVGIVVRGCDSRSVVQLLQENLIARENVTIFGMPCEGTFNMARVEQELGRYSQIESVSWTKDAMTVRYDGQEKSFPMKEYAQNMCLSCTDPCAVLSDAFVGEKTSVAAGSGTPKELAMLDAMSLPERFRFWRTQMDRCLRCYACRNSCPLCVCQDQCVAESRDPHWMTQEDTAQEKLFFQLVHAGHLAGRCTGCGECQRACPVGIPILALRQQYMRAVEEVFQYRAGMDVDARPPLLGYAVEESSIREREW